MSTFQKRGPQRNMTLYWIYGFTKRTKFCFKFQIKWKKSNTQDKIAIYPIKKKRCHAVGTKVAKQKYVDGKKGEGNRFHSQWVINSLDVFFPRDRMGCIGRKVCFYLVPSSYGTSVPKSVPCKIPLLKFNGSHRTSDASNFQRAWQHHWKWCSFDLENEN